MGKAMTAMDPQIEMSVLLDEWGKWVVSGRPGPGKYVCPLGRLRSGGLPPAMISEDMAEQIEAGFRAMTGSAALRQQADALYLLHVRKVESYEKLGHALRLGKAARFKARDLVLAGQAFMHGFLADRRARSR